MPNDNNILICRVNNDSTTKYIYSWAEKIKEEAELLGFNVIELNNEDFDEHKLRKMIEEHDPFLVFLNAHGSQYSIKGMDGQTDVVVRCKNDHLFKDRIVYALFCHTFSILGHSAKNKGCECYIGYNNEFRFPFLDLSQEKVFEDDVSEPFMRVSNEIMLSLLKGKSPEEAYTNSQKLIVEFIDFWQKRESDKSSTIIRWLKVIKNIQVMVTQ